MSMAFIIFLLALAGASIYFMTPHGRAIFKGIRSNVMLFLGGIPVMMDQLLPNLQAIPWETYLTRLEALWASICVYVVSAFFTALKGTKK